MSAKVVARVENVGKCYHIYNKNIDRLKQSLTFGRRQLYHEFWALRDISFEVEQGDTVGIVGSNGSGKSTLLQILFGVLQPTVGRVEVPGKVGGLLELGAGFNPEETGRENVLVNLAILGIPSEDIPEFFERVAAFADIGEFIEQPVKLYSSGMAVRLGFALQISTPFDILVIDEALAVGDELFQRKCFSALEGFRNRGGTILFVSHGAGSVRQLCKKALFLDHGQLIQQGNCKTVVDNYQKFLYMREPDRSQFRERLLLGLGGEAPEIGIDATSAPAGDVSGGQAEAPAAVEKTAENAADPPPPPSEYQEDLKSPTALVYQSLGAAISDPRVETLDGRRVNVLNPLERYRYCYQVEFTENARQIVFGWLLKSTSGLELSGGAHDSMDAVVREVAAGSTYEVSFEFTAALYPGVYYLNCGVSGVTDQHSGYLHRVVDAVAFRVRNVYVKFHVGFADLDYRSNFRMLTAADRGGPGALDATAPR
jgi:lipopolysaccharide transport system ATP-binding protein